MKPARADLSPWFFHRNPDLPGVYRRYAQAVPPRFARWDGTKWYASSFSVENAANETEVSTVQHIVGGWCGLARRITW